MRDIVITYLPHLGQNIPHSINRHTLKCIFDIQQIKGKGNVALYQELALNSIRTFVIALSQYESGVYSFTSIS